MADNTPPRRSHPGSDGPPREGAAPSADHVQVPPAAARRSAARREVPPSDPASTPAAAAAATPRRQTPAPHEDQQTVEVQVTEQAPAPAPQPVPESGPAQPAGPPPANPPAGRSPRRRRADAAVEHTGDAGTVLSGASAAAAPFLAVSAIPEAARHLTGEVRREQEARRAAQEGQPPAGPPGSSQPVGRTNSGAAATTRRDANTAAPAAGRTPRRAQQQPRRGARRGQGLLAAAGLGGGGRNPGRGKKTAVTLTARQQRRRRRRRLGVGGLIGLVLLPLVAGILILLMLFTLLASVVGQEEVNNIGQQQNCFDGLMPTDPNVPGGQPAPNPNQTQETIAKGIMATAKKLGVSRQAVIIALMTAKQESDMGADPTSRYPNSDIDTGVFQQRAIPGWYAHLSTTEANNTQLQDITYSTAVFFLGRTVDKAYPNGAGPVGYHIPGLLDIKGWEGMSLTRAAQAVQRSAYPDAYAKWETYANQLYEKHWNSVTAVAAIPAAVTAGAKSSTGGNPANPADPDMMAAPIDGCGPAAYQLAADCPLTPDLKAATAGMQPDTVLVTACVHAKFPKIKYFYGVREDPFPDHPSGRAVDVMTSDAGWPSHRDPGALAYGDQIAAYLQANAAQLGVEYLIWKQRIWNVNRNDEGWRPMASRGGDTENHFDHVHVTTFGNKATLAAGGGPGSDLLVTGKVTYPLKAGTYSLGAYWGKTGSWARYHTGQDFAAPEGTPIYAAAAGTIGNSVTASWAGNNVVIHHGGGVSTLYAHMSKKVAQPGQTVKVGQLIGYVGNTGRSFGAHLHFEYYPPGTTPGDVYSSKDPMVWLNANMGKGNAV